MYVQIDEHPRMPSVCITAVYFGRPPVYHRLFLRTCASNPTIDFLFIGDQLSSFECPPNVTVLPCRFADIETLIKKTLGDDISIESPYKICDYKPLFGLLFSEQLKRYDYVGNCDFDLLWGDLRTFFEQHNLSNYEKFLTRGHLTLYRNNPEVLLRYRLDGSDYGSFDNAAAIPRCCGFDEDPGIKKIYEKHGFSQFDTAADGYWIHADLAGDLWNTRLEFNRREESGVNHRHQVFYWESGKLYLAYLDDGGSIHVREYAYAHPFRYIRDFDDALTARSFYLTKTKFIPKECGIPDLKAIVTINKKHYSQLLKYPFRGLLK